MRTVIVVFIYALLLFTGAAAQLAGRLQTFDGTPISDARVRLHSDDTTLVVSVGPDGSFLFPEPMAGDSGILESQDIGHYRRIKVTPLDRFVVVPMSSIVIQLCPTHGGDPMVVGRACDRWDLYTVRELRVEVEGAVSEATGRMRVPVLQPVRLRIRVKGSCVRPGPVHTVVDGQRVHILVTEYRNDAGCSDGVETSYEHIVLHTFVVPGLYDVYFVQFMSDLMIRFEVTEAEPSGQF